MRIEPDEGADDFEILTLALDDAFEIVFFAELRAGSEEHAPHRSGGKNPDEKHFHLLHCQQAEIGEVRIARCVAEAILPINGLVIIIVGDDALVIDEPLQDPHFGVTDPAHHVADFIVEIVPEQP